MRILYWMQNKLNGRKRANSTPTTSHMPEEPKREEHSDWPQGFLAIGTLGNNDLKEEPKKSNLDHGEDSSEEHVQGLTQEEVGRLKDKIKSILLHKQQTNSTAAELEDSFDLQLDNFLNDSSNLEIGKAIAIASPEPESRNKNARYLLRTNSDIGKKSLSFLLKKIFICRSGFAPTPSLRDPIPETRMEKILRTLLHKKIYPQGSSPTLSQKKTLPNRHMMRYANKDEMDDNEGNRSKWVKTDSEYIVLEI